MVVPRSALKQHQSPGQLPSSVTPWTQNGLAVGWDLRYRRITGRGSQGPPGQLSKRCEKVVVGWKVSTHLAGSRRPQQPGMKRVALAAADQLGGLGCDFPSLSLSYFISPLGMVQFLN